MRKASDKSKDTTKDTDTVMKEPNDNEVEEVKKETNGEEELPSKTKEEEKEDEDDEDKTPAVPKRRKTRRSIKEKMMKEEEQVKEEQKQQQQQEEEQAKDNEDDEDNDADDEKEDTAVVGKGRPRRNVRTTAYQPIDFKPIDLVPGRGTKLDDLPSVREQIKKYEWDSEEVKCAHRFLFRKRGRVAKNEVKKKLLQFSGYLREIVPGESKEELAAEDDKAECEYYHRACRLEFIEIKRLCDFFNVDRKPDEGERVDKDFLIERLCDFLGAPDRILLNDYETSSDESDEKEEKRDSSKKRKRTEEKKTKEEEERTTVEEKSKKEDKIIQDWVEYERKEGHFALLRDHIKGDEPSDVALKQWVLAYCVCHNMNKATLRDVIDTASDKFGVDMRDRKDRIKWFLAGEM